MKKTSIRFITEIGIFSAVGLAIDFLAGLYSDIIWPLGGSISITMVAIFLMAYRWGLKGGLITGLLIGTIQILWAGSGAVYPLQIILDYVLAYTVVGVAGFYSKKIAYQQELTGKLYYVTNGIILAGVLRTIIHIISGYVYFREYTPEGLEKIKLTWSIIYNLGYMVPSIILCLIIVRVIYAKYHSLVEYQE